MATARFFERTALAVGGAVGVNRAELEARLADAVPGVAVHDTGAQNGRHIAELSVNLLARLYPRIAITGVGEMADSLRAHATAINPTIELVSSPDPELTIFVDEQAARGGITPSVSGWVVKLSSTKGLTGPENPYAAGTAAALAAGEVFRRVFAPSGAGRAWREVNLSLLDYGESAGGGEDLPPVELGVVGYIGVGAVGNAGLWALGRHPGIAGSLHLVDHECVELSNLQRYVLTGDRSPGVPKVVLGDRALSGTGLRVHRRRMALEEWADRALRGQGVPTLCISTDSTASRRHAQAILPRLVVNGWTGPGTYGASSHTFVGDQPCLACLYHPTGPTKSLTERVAEALGLEHRHAAQLWLDNAPLPEADTPTVAQKLAVPEGELEKWRGISIRQLHQDVICGSALVHLRAPTEAPQYVPLAHQSALAGILMAAELVKRSSTTLAARAQPESLVRCDDVVRRTRGVWTVTRKKVPGCICGDHDYVAAYNRKWGQARRAKV